MNRCPLCRARLSGKTGCPRCGADLTLAQAAQHQAMTELKQALRCRAAHDNQRAAAHANQALQLHRTPLTEAVHRALFHTYFR